MNSTVILDQEDQVVFKRPWAITIICILGFVGASLSVPMIFSDIAMQIGNWFPPYSGFVAAVNFVCMLGLWFTKKWAVYSYIILVAVNQLVLITMDRWNLLTLIVQSVIILIILVYLDAKVKSLSKDLIRHIRRQIWAVIVAYMVGIHNFYREEQKDPEGTTIVAEDIESEENSTPQGLKAKEIYSPPAIASPPVLDFMSLVLVPS